MENQKKVRITCCNRPRWNGIILSSHPHGKHRLGAQAFSGIACNDALRSIFPNDRDDAIVVEFTNDGLKVSSEGMPSIALPGNRRGSKEGIHLPYGKRHQLTFEGFTLKVEAA